MRTKIIIIFFFFQKKHWTLNFCIETKYQRCVQFLLRQFVSGFNTEIYEYAFHSGCWNDWYPSLMYVSTVVVTL